MYATVGKKCQWVIPQTHAYHLFMYLYARLTTWCEHLEHMLSEGFEERVVHINELGRLVQEIYVLVKKILL